MTITQGSTQLPGAPASTDVCLLGPLARGADDLAVWLSITAAADDEHAAAWNLLLPVTRAGRGRRLRMAAWLDDPYCELDSETVGHSRRASTRRGSRASRSTHRRRRFRSRRATTKPSGTDHCMKEHIGYAVSGTLDVWLTDGTRKTLRAGDAYVIPPGHDATNSGGEPSVCIEFASADTYAKS